MQEKDEKNITLSPMVSLYSIIIGNVMLFSIDFLFVKFFTMSMY